MSTLFLYIELLNDMKKILLVLTNVVTENFKYCLQELGYEVEIFIAQNTDEEKSAEELSQRLNSSFYAVFMYDYFPNYAEVCYIKKVYYVTWIVDYPHFSLCSDTVKYSTNRIFTFEKYQLIDSKNSNHGHIFYMPLASDIRYFDKALKRECKTIKNTDVSFMGSLYNSQDKNLYLAIKYLPDYISGYFTALILAQQKVAENIITSDCISESMEQELKKYIWFEAGSKYSFDYTKKITELLQKHTTCVERCNAVSLLNKYFDFILYTGSNTEFDKSIKNHGYINYNTEMPFVFQRSKVNINITLKSILTAIPLRALDIMACGGFLLSDYQEDLATYFVDGKECVMFYNIEDMLEKTEYYLKNEAERIAIARAGQEKTRAEFSLEVQLAKIKCILEENE